MGTPAGLMTVGDLLEILSDVDPEWNVPREFPITIATADGTTLGHVVDATGTLAGEDRHFTLHIEATRPGPLVASGRGS